MSRRNTSPVDRLVHEVDVHPPGERVRDDERRRREVVRLHLAVDARLEVPVAREHGADDEVALVDRGRDLVRQRAGVADARRAAVADEVEAELVEIPVEPGALVVLGDDLRARRERRLHPRLARQAALDRLLREQAGADHHRRVRGVRARGDRGDDDGAVLERVVRPATATRFFSRDGGRRRRRCAVGAAVARRRVARRERVGDLLVVRAVLVVDAERARAPR